MLTASTILTPLQLLKCLNILIHHYMQEHGFVLVVGSYQINYPNMRFNLAEDFDITTNWHSTDPSVIIIDVKQLRTFLRIIHDEVEEPKFRSINSNVKMIIIGSTISAKNVNSLRLFGFQNTILLDQRGNISKLIVNKRMSSNFIDTQHAELHAVDGNIFEKLVVEDIFKNGELKDLNGLKLALCYPRRCVICHNGMEVQTFTFIFNHLNITAEQYVIQNENFLTCDIFFGYSNQNDVALLDFTIPYIYDTASWYVPTPKPLSKLLFFLRIFPPEIWFILIFCVLSISIVWFLVNLLLNQKQNRKSSLVEHILIIIFLFLEQSRRFQFNNSSVFVLTSVVIFMTFITNAIFKCKFLYHLIGEDFVQKINSFEDILRYEVPMIRNNFEIGRIFIPDGLSIDTQKCVTSLECLKYCSENENIALLSLDRTARHFWQVLNPNGVLNIRRLNPPFLSMKYAAAMRSGHPFLSVFNEYLRRIIEHGFLEKIIANYDSQAKYVEYSVAHVRLSLKHLIASFAMLGAGLLLSTIAAIWEICVLTFELC
ncbi:hypothetical protein WA026_016332 [Henosepilachna vigintioctopunctata]|uniref:Ionotropic receptor n=1 Tax=Henosepilachna vigintioctopunctata TaxID=420089 RepID=A0AAW1UNP8_9CUCU